MQDATKLIEATSELTTSSLPGTTLGIVKIPKAHIGFALHDTPGIPNLSQAYSLIENYQDLMTVFPTKRIKPYNIQLKAGTSVWLGALARLDVIKRSGVRLSICVGGNVTIHKTTVEKADRVYEFHAGTMLRPAYSTNPAKIEWEIHDIALEGNGKEIAISGLGWVGVESNGLCEILLRLPKGVGYVVRDGLTPFEIEDKGLQKHRPVPLNMTTRRNRELGKKYVERIETEKRLAIAAREKTKEKEAGSSTPIPQPTQSPHQDDKTAEAGKGKGSEASK